MRHQIFIWDRYQKWTRQRDRWIDWLWIVGLLLAAMLLFGINLGGLPLRDWDEGTVAQVAREIWRTPAGDWRWLYPTPENSPYVNKPPLMHWLIALAYSVGGVNEWTTRLPGAALTAISVPLLYGIGREIFPQRLPAIFSALVYLTTLPVVRHGRLAMLDGAVICFFLFTIWCLLRSRRNLHYCLGVGAGLGLICLTKGILGLLLGAIALGFLAWNTPRLLTSWYMWTGIFLGSVPIFWWYAAQWLHYGQFFAQTGVVHQSFSRIWTAVEHHSGPPWYYILELGKSGWPWIIFLPLAGLSAWENRNLSWAKLVLVWAGGYLLAISVMGTKLPWYILPIYPAIALMVGVYLAEVWQWYIPAAYPRPWIAILTLLAVLGWGGSIYYSPWSPAADGEVQMILLAVAITMSFAAILAGRGDRQFLSILFWGMYVSLLLLMTSEHWNWELAEAYPVKPVAAIVQTGTPAGQTVYTSFPYGRPTLNFYSDRQVIPANLGHLKQQWQQNQQPYLLLDRATLSSLSLESVHRVGTAEGWNLITKTTNNN